LQAIGEVIVNAMLVTNANIAAIVLWAAAFLLAII
jgi:hypothetical protein